jgi:hypothetical protein
MSYDKFVKYLLASVDPQFAVAKWLHCQGVDVSIGGLKVQPESDTSDNYSDGGDITTPKGVIDVKHLVNTEFTCAEDFPHKRATAGFKPSIDKLMPLGLHAAFFVNSAITHAYIVKTKSSKHWSQWPVQDAVTGLMKDSYFVSLEYCKFIDLRGKPK